MLHSIIYQIYFFWSDKKVDWSKVQIFQRRNYMRYQDRIYKMFNIPYHLYLMIFIAKNPRFLILFLKMYIKAVSSPTTVSYRFPINLEVDFLSSQLSKYRLYIHVEIILFMRSFYIHFFFEFSILRSNFLVSFFKVESFYSTSVCNI